MGGLSPTIKIQTINQFVILSFGVDPFGVDPFTEIGEMACSTPAWRTHGLTLKSARLYSWLGILNYISCLISWFKISFLSLCHLLFSVVRIKWIWSFRSKCKWQWFWDLVLITSVHLNRLQLTANTVNLALVKIQKWLVGWVILEIGSKYDFFDSFCSKAIITLPTTQWQIDLIEQSRLMVNSLYKNVSCWYFYTLLWKWSVCFDRPEY